MKTIEKTLGALLALGLVAATSACGGSDTPSGVDMAAADGTGTGPAANLKCGAGKNAWQTYGVNAFVAVNKAIFANVTKEVTANVTKNLGDSFTKVGSGNPPSTKDDAATFEGKLAAFLVYVYGGPNKITYGDGKSYSGLQDMTAAHIGLNITAAQYDYFVANIVVPALTANGVPMADVSACFAPPLVDAVFKASIVGK